MTTYVDPRTRKTVIWAIVALVIIILPLVIPPNVDPTKELDQNSGNYKVVWDVLNALRAHDERLAIEIEWIKLDRTKK